MKLNIEELDILIRALGYEHNTLRYRLIDEYGKQRLKRKVAKEDKRVSK